MTDEPVTHRSDAPAAPDEAASVFGAALPLAEQYAQLLCTEGVVRGLIGPREPERIWQRHVLNCAVVAELTEPGDRIVDVGSGAGLPGIAMALAQPQLQVDLLEPLQRRVDFLSLAVDVLGLGERVRVVRGRAEEPGSVAAVGGADRVVARAVAPLDRLVRWCLPLVRPDGRLLLMKGSSAVAEVAEHRASVTRLGGREIEIESCGESVVEPAVVVVTMTRAVRRGRG